MLYYNFRDFEGFKERFGIQHHGNGEKSRKNKILLSFIKNPRLLRDAAASGDYHLLHISSMAELKRTLTAHIRRSGRDDGNMPHKVNILGDIYRSSLYYTDEYNGICEDNDYKSFRYVNAENGRVYKMKAGRMFRKILLETAFGRTLPEQVVTYLCEEMVQDWQSYAMSCLPRYKLYVNDDFERIYDSDCLEGNFNSCMVDKGFHSFYEDAVDAGAACLENESGKIIARCVIFNQVKDQTGKIWRLAERQYSSGGSNVLKRALVDALIRGGHIDGYKTVGAGCSDTSAFVDNDGNSLGDRNFSIECNLDFGDTLSYQDSFKNYDDNDRIATNYGVGYLQLDTTEGELEDQDQDQEYDDYHEEYCEETTTVHYRGREMYCDSDRLEDFRWVGIESEYHHEDDVSICEHCEEYFLPDNAYCSDLTDEYYCCTTCLERAETRYKEENWTYSEYDGEYFEDEVTEFLSWNQYLGRYVSRTISQESLDSRVESGDFYLVDDVAYDAINTETGLPFPDAALSDTLSTIAA